MPIDPRRIEVMDEHMAEVMRAKTPEQRLAIATGMWRSARRMSEAAVAQQHPRWTEAQIAAEVARRMACGSG